MNTKQQSIVNVICRAIRNKNLIQIYYEDKHEENNDWRIIAPHIIWKNKSTQNITLLGWFLPTEEQRILKGQKPDWKNYLIDEMELSKIKTLDKRFTKTAKGYKGQQHKLADFIYCYTPISL